MKINKMLIVKKEPKKMLIVEEEFKNEPKNYDDEWAKWYTYFMVQIQVKIEKDWVHMEPRRELNMDPKGELHRKPKSWVIFMPKEGRHARQIGLFYFYMIKWVLDLMPIFGIYFLVWFSIYYFNKSRIQMS